MEYYLHKQYKKVNFFWEKCVGEDWGCGFKEVSYFFVWSPSGLLFSADILYHTCIKLLLFYVLTYVCTKLWFLNSIFLPIVLVVQECRSKLLAAGFQELKEREHWEIQPTNKASQEIFLSIKLSDFLIAFFWFCFTNRTFRPVHFPNWFFVIPE